MYRSRRQPAQNAAFPVGRDHRGHMLHGDHHDPEHQRCRRPDVNGTQPAQFRRGRPEIGNGTQPEKERRGEQHPEEHCGTVSKEELRLHLDHVREGTHMDQASSWRGADDSGGRPVKATKASSRLR
ncbi:hypothetical protein SDC9_78017 [bioreactor metagenome]|uniref:Uncharacterized protein n=1 Tax=bioreactor metagenome TaxID=1076179 RepID=A0A644YS98_9ZZZZ